MHAETNLRAAVAQKLDAEAHAMLAGTEPGGDARAFQQILAARTLSRPRRPVCSTPQCFNGSRTLKIITGRHRRSATRWRSAPTGTAWPAPGVDRTVRLWNADTGQPLGQRPLIGPGQGDSRRVWSVAFSPDGHRLASGGDDATVRLWNADTGQPLGSPLTGHTDDA